MAAVKINQCSIAVANDNILTWYCCLLCHEINILRDFAFCPMCGAELEWVEE